MRVTRRLTNRAARKIKGAAIKAAQEGLGMRTFMTFTCSPDDRRAVAEGEIVLGREMKRTLNAIQQRFRRHGYADFAFIWVAENPAEENPHVHLLTNHRVPRAEFLEFAAWVESLWGHGWVKIEPIRKPASAGRYILKAVRYAAKGADEEQGAVCGNRYGISRNIQVDETTDDVCDREDEARVFAGLLGTAPSEGGEPLGKLWLTRYGLSFPAGSAFQEVGDVLDVLKYGEIPG
jgi:hypothetical protein